MFRCSLFVSFVVIFCTNIGIILVWFWHKNYKKIDTDFLTIPWCVFRPLLAPKIINLGSLCPPLATPLRPFGVSLRCWTPEGLIAQGWTAVCLVTALPPRSAKYVRSWSVPGPYWMRPGIRNDPISNYSRVWTNSRWSISNGFPIHRFPVTSRRLTLLYECEEWCPMNVRRLLKHFEQPFFLFLFRPPS